MGGLTFALALHARLCGRQLRLRRLPRLGQLAADEQRVSSRSRSRRSINRSRNSPSSFGISLLDDDDRSTPSNHPSGFVVGGVVGFLLPPLFFVFRPEFEFILSLKSSQRRSTHQQSIQPELFIGRQPYPTSAAQRYSKFYIIEIVKYRFR